MNSITILGGLAVVGLSTLVDSNGTVFLIKAIITIRGISWICKKITESINHNASEIINFTGWCIAGGNIIKLIVNASNGVNIVTKPLAETITKTNASFMNFANFIDKLTFWN